MSLARYLSKLGALLNSSGQVLAGGHADASITRAKMAAGTLGNIAGHAGIGVNTTLTSADAGKVFSVYNAGLAIQIDTSGLTVGDRFMFIGNGGGATLTRTDGGNFYSLGAFTGTSIAFTTGQGVSFYWDGNGLIVENFGLNLKYSVNFGYSLGDSGFQRLPSGLIIQWGRLVTNNVTDTAVTFPVAYPSNVGFVTVAMNTRVGGADQYLNGAIAYGVANNGFTLQNRVDSNGNTFRWLAVGY